jgi:hypothetical protein
MAEEDTNLPFLMLRPTLGSGVPSITLSARRLRAFAIEKVHVVR